MSHKTYFFIRFLVLGIIIGGTIYLLFFNPFLKVRKWIFQGETDINLSEAQQIIETKASKKWFIFPQDNFFIVLFRRHSFEKTLEKHFLELTEVKVWPAQEHLFNNFNISLSKREKAAIWCSSNCFYIDREGLLFKKAPQTAGPFITLIEDKIGLNLEINARIKDQNLLQAIFLLKEQFDNTTKLSIKNIEVFNDNHDFALITNQNWKLYFDPQTNIENQWNVFKALLNKNSLSLNDSINYIDLRIKNKAYIKKN
jgi:hypothetical protein